MLSFMREKLLLLFLSLLGANQLQAQVVNIPDANFKAALLVHSPKIDVNNDGEIQVSEAEAFTGTINVIRKNITSLAGIEAFVNITRLLCSNNNLTSLDVSKNTAIAALGCDNNQLTALDLSKNTALTSIGCINNRLTSLDITKNIALTSLSCYNNQLATLDVSQNALLTGLNFSSNPIQVIELDNCKQLTNLRCSATKIKTLDVSQFPNLLALECYSNSELENLNIKNGNNTAFSRMLAHENPKLTCIQVDDVAYSNAQTIDMFSSWTKDATATYNTDCRPVVNIPDANFKAYLLGNATINTDGDTEIQVEEAEVFTGTISCNHRNITDLTGIEAFVNITALLANNNQLTELNVTKNTALKFLFCENNQLNSLDVTQNTALEMMYCNSNKIANLDLTKNTALNALLCNDNLLSELDVSKNTILTRLICGKNPISSLDISNNIALTQLFCENSPALSSLNLKNGKNDILYLVIANQNPKLFCIEVDDVDQANTYTTNGGWQKDNSANYNENCNYTLPVTLVEFKASATGNSAKLEWSTASEQRNRGFIIYRRGDDSKSIKIAEIPPATKRQGIHYSYSYIDRMPLNGNNYYELHQLDDDGKINNLGVRNVSFSLADQRITFYPNPTSDWIDINFKDNNFNSLWVFDMGGKLLFSKAIGTTESSTRIFLNNVAAGTYVLRLRGELHQETIKVVKN